jgi:hypothetical protein
MRLSRLSCRVLLVLLMVPGFGSAVARAQRAPAADEAIEGVQAAALDQPRVYLNLRRTARGPVLETGGKESVSGIEAFLDTGASGVMLPEDTVKQLGIRTEQGRDGKAVQFEDAGIAGSEHFAVSEPLFLAAAHYDSNTTGEEAAAYSAPFGPIRAQVRPAGGILQMLAPNLGIAGMPVMAGRVAVIDTKGLAAFEKLRTALYPPGDRRIPKTTKHVPLTYISFARFTRTTPAGAPGPNLGSNPMIGPDPFNPNTATKPVILRHGNKTARATLLLDTGAAASILSTQVAAKLGITVNNNGALAGVPQDQQFSLPVGGLGGMKNATGTFFDRLELPTREGPPVAYKRAPFLVSDISVRDAEGKTFTLDGVIGMNFLCASAEIKGGLLPDIGNIVASPFRYVVVDNKTGVLGLVPN